MLATAAEALMDLLEPAARAWRISPPPPAEPAKLLLARRVGPVFDARNAQRAALLAFGTLVPWLVYERCDEEMIVDGIRDLETLARALPSRCDDGWGC
jgi:hypothetical protein